MSYLLQYNRLAQRRLQLQHQRYKKSSENLLITAGLKPGMKVMEVGCGIGLMTEYLAKMVTNKGNVLAFDKNADYVEITGQRIANEHQVFIYEKDIYDVKDFDQQFDLIYGRMVINHLQQPQQALEDLVSCLKPGAALVLEECPSIKGIFAYPESKALNAIVNLAIRMAKIENIHYEIAYTMQDVLKSLSCEIELNQIFQPICRNEEEKLIHGMTLEEIAPKAIELGVATEAEVTELKHALEQELPSRQLVTLFSVVQIIARK